VNSYKYNQLIDEVGNWRIDNYVYNTDMEYTNYENIILERLNNLADMVDDIKYDNTYIDYNESTNIEFILERLDNFYDTIQELKNFIETYDYQSLYQEAIGRDFPVQLKTINGEKYFPNNTTVMLLDKTEGYISDAYPLTDIERFAGKDTDVIISNQSVIEELLKRYPKTRESDWFRIKAKGYVKRYKYELHSKPAEIHWWECNKVAPQLRKVTKML